jgi:hypothetical protein
MTRIAVAVIARREAWVRRSTLKVAGGDMYAIGTLRATDRGQSTSQPCRANTKIKFVEIRDKSTSVPAMAICPWPTGDPLLQGAGYSLEYPAITLTGLTDGAVSTTPTVGRILRIGACPDTPRGDEGTPFDKKLYRK